MQQDDYVKQHTYSYIFMETSPRTTYVMRVQLMMWHGSFGWLISFQRPIAFWHIIFIYAHSTCHNRKVANIFKVRLMQLSRPSLYVCVCVYMFVLISHILWYVRASCDVNSSNLVFVYVFLVGRLTSHNAYARARVWKSTWPWTTVAEICSRIQLFYAFLALMRLTRPAARSVALVHRQYVAVYITCITCAITHSMTKAYLCVSLCVWVADNILATNKNTLFFVYDKYI